MQLTRDFRFSSAGLGGRDWRAGYGFAGVTPLAVYDYQAQRFGASRPQPFSTTHSFSRASPAWRFDENGQFTSAPMDAPRFTYGLGSQAIRGLVFEPPLRNEQPNTALLGAVQGPLEGMGALPQGWKVTGLPDSAITVESIAPRNGVPTVRLRLAGTPTSRVYLFLSSPTAIAASSSEPWTVSLSLAHVAGSFSNIASMVQYISGWTSSGSYVSGSPFAGENLLPVLDDTLRNVQVTDNLRNSGAERLRASLQFLTEGDVDITLDLALPYAATGPAPLIGLVSDSASVSAPVVQAEDAISIIDLEESAYDVLLRTESLREVVLRNQAVIGGQYWPSLVVQDVIQQLCLFPAGSI